MILMVPDQLTWFSIFSSSLRFLLLKAISDELNVTTDDRTHDLRITNILLYSPFIPIKYGSNQES
jgi:hypothetical protein